MKLDNFIFDVCNSACLMYEEAQSYHFLHRSFQEYFFADYYSRQDDTTMKKLGRFLANTDLDPFDDGSAFDMLYDLAPEKVERFIILPYLSDIFTDGSRREQYWRYLIRGYKAWTFIIMNPDAIEYMSEDVEVVGPHLRQSNNCDCNSIIQAKILSILHQKLYFPIDSSSIPKEHAGHISAILYGEKYERAKDRIFIYPSVILTEELLEKRKSMRPSLDHLASDPTGKPLEFGYICNFNFQDGIDNPQDYTEIVAIWDDKKCPAQRQFDNVKKYYSVLFKKYEKADEMDDDDF